MSPQSSEHGGPVLPKTARPGGLTPLRGRARLRDGLPGGRQEVNALHGLEHGWKMLEAAGTTANFAVAAQGGSAYNGDSYLDSDVYKWLEAVSWQQQRGLTEPVARAFGQALDLLETAQLPDGYLNTYVQVHAPRWRWAPTNRHEFYNLSHLIQAGVAAARSADGGRLFEIALRAADQLERACTGKANVWNVGHPGIEMALTELYRITDEERYLGLAARLLEFRGERQDVLVGSGLSDWEDVLLPVPWDPELTGHAVCAAYLAAGMTDLLAELGERRIEDAIDAKWQDMVLRKSYLTGNIGSRHAGEAVGCAYELPSGRAYCETCAGVGILMWCWRLLLLRGEARYADRFEQVLYNSVLCGVGLRGDRFFYANPLEDPGEMERLPWYRCSCCPTNVMRLLAQLEHYIATQDGSGIQIHQYASAQIAAALDHAGPVQLCVTSEFPLDGAVRVRVEEPGSRSWTLSIRRPAWCGGEPAVLVNGAPTPGNGARPGYITVRRDWAAGDELSVEFPLSADFVEADWRSHDQRGTIAVVRGPIVYCAEGHDQPEGLDLASVRIVPGAPLHASRRAGPIGDHVVLRARMRRADYNADDGLYRPWEPGRQAASRASLADQEEELSLIPYFLWANRGRSQMRVWHDVAIAPEP
jgi:uncharacterized protein